MADINIDSLEPNSHKYKAEKARMSREKISPVINKEQVISTKKPLGKKFAEIFMPEDTKDLKTWLIKDVIVPGVQNTILDILSMAFFGETRSRNRSDPRRRSDNRYDYRGCYRESSDYRRSSYRRNEERYESGDVVDFRNIILRNREDAENLISAMRDRIRNTDSKSVSVAELLDMIDATTSSRYTDNNWGWDDERDIGIRRVSSGYLIDVAEPKYLG